MYCIERGLHNSYREDWALCDKCTCTLISDSVFMCALLCAGEREMSASVFTERKTLQDECANILLIQVDVCVCVCEREIYSHDLNSFQGVCVCVCAPVCVREGLRCNVSSEVYIFDN